MGIAGLSLSDAERRGEADILSGEVSSSAEVIASEVT